MDLASAIKETGNLIHSAQVDILIYDGHLDPKIYQREDISKRLKDAANRGVKIEAICDNEAEINNKRIKEMIEKEKILLHRKRLSHSKGLYKMFSKYHIDKGHFMVVDGYHTRKEDSHKLDSDKRRALITFLNPVIAHKYTQEFDRILKSV